MQSRKQLVVGFASLTLFIAIAVWLTFALALPAIQGATKSFMGLSPQVSAAIVAGLVVLIASPLTAFLTKGWERKSLVEQDIQKLKILIYESYMQLFFKIFQSSRNGGTLSSQDIIDFQDANLQKLIIWGSDKVLKQYVVFSRKMIEFDKLKKKAIHDGKTLSKPEEDRQTKIFLLEFEKLLQCFRADIGQSNKSLAEADLLSLFINDLDGPTILPLPDATVS